jgi:chromate transporter
LRLDIPVLQSAVPAAMALSAAAAIAIFRFKASVIATLLACAAAGMLWTLVVG